MDRYPYYPPGFMRAEQSMNMEEKPQNDMNCDKMPLAMAFVQPQQWRDIYERDKALLRGTLFYELDKPFRGSGR